MVKNKKVLIRRQFCAFWMSGRILVFRLLFFIVSKVTLSDRKVWCKPQNWSFWPVHHKLPLSVFWPVSMRLIMRQQSHKQSQHGGTWQHLQNGYFEASTGMVDFAVVAEVVVGGEEFCVFCQELERTAQNTLYNDDQTRSHHIISQ